MFFKRFLHHPAFIIPISRSSLYSRTTKIYKCRWCWITDQWCAVINMVMSLRFLQKAGKLSTNGVSVSFPRRIPFQDVSEKKARVNPAKPWGFHRRRRYYWSSELPLVGKMPCSESSYRGRRIQNGLIGPETSVRNYHYSLRNNPQQHSSTSRTTLEITHNLAQVMLQRGLCR
jgi:hypothetical protein